MYLNITRSSSYMSFQLFVKHIRYIILLTHIFQNKTD